MTPGRALDMRKACEQRAEMFRVDLFIEKLRGMLH